MIREREWDTGWSSRFWLIWSVATCWCHFKHLPLTVFILCNNSQNMTEMLNHEKHCWNLRLLLKVLNCDAAVNLKSHEWIMHLKNAVVCWHCHDWKKASEPKNVALIESSSSCLLVGKRWLIVLSPCEKVRPAQSTNYGPCLAERKGDKTLNKGSSHISRQWGARRIGERRT